VAFLPEGVAVAHVSRAKAPRLVACDFQECDETQRQATLEELVKKHKLGNVACNHVLEPNAYQLLQVEAPNVPEDEVRSALRWHVKDLIEFHIDDAVLDVFELPAEAQRTGTNMMFVVAARAPLVRERVAIIEDAGLKLHAIDINELAMRNITALLPEDNGGVLFAHLGNGVGQIIVTREQKLFLGRNIETAIGTVDSMTAGDGTLDELPFEIQHQLDALVQEIQRSQDYYERYFAQPAVQGLVFAPMVYEQPALMPYVYENLGLAARTMDIAGLIDAEGLDRALQARCLSAIGAALREEKAAL